MKLRLLTLLDFLGFRPLCGSSTMAVLVLNTEWHCCYLGACELMAINCIRDLGEILVHKHGRGLNNIKYKSAVNEMHNLRDVYPPKCHSKVNYMLSLFLY